MGFHHPSKAAVPDVAQPPGSIPGGSSFKRKRRAGVEYKECQARRGGRHGHSETHFTRHNTLWHHTQLYIDIDLFSNFGGVRWLANLQVAEKGAEPEPGAQSLASSLRNRRPPDILVRPLSRKPERQRSREERRRGLKAPSDKHRYGGKNRDPDAP